MSRNKKLKNTPNTHQNCVTLELDSVKSAASRLKKEHDKWESKQTFEVIKPDHKTTIYKRIKSGASTKGKVIHKGII